MQDYINGCYTREGTRPIAKSEIKGTGKLYNGMTFIAGYVPEDGVSVDVYRDEACTDLVFMEHGFQVFGHGDLATRLVWPKAVIELLCDGATMRAREMKL